MKQLLLILSFTLGLATTSNAETWSCTYLWNGKPMNSIYVRQGDWFLSVLPETELEIVYEDDNMISLHRSFSRRTPTYFAVLLDKTKSMFANVGLEVGNNTLIVEGKCKVY